MISHRAVPTHAKENCTIFFGLQQIANLLKGYPRKKKVLHFSPGCDRCSNLLVSKLCQHTIAKLPEFGRRFPKTLTFYSRDPYK